MTTATMEDFATATSVDQVRRDVRIAGPRTAESVEVDNEKNDSTKLSVHIPQKNFHPHSPPDFGPSPARRLRILQQWEGIVTEVEGEIFWADLHDLTDTSNPLEVAEIPLVEFSEADRVLIAPGRVFYWCIAYDDTGGQRRRVSEFNVRRTPTWSKKAINSMKARATEMGKRIRANGAE